MKYQPIPSVSNGWSLRKEEVLTRNTLGKLLQFLKQTLYLWLEYLIALFGRLSTINNDKEILPYHKICVHLSVNANQGDAITSMFTRIIPDKSVVAMIDMNWNTMSSTLGPILAEFTIPLINIRNAMTYSAINPIKMATSAIETNHQRNYCFYISSGVADMFEAIDTMANYYGWKTAGLLVTKKHKFHNPQFCTSSIQLKHTR